MQGNGAAFSFQELTHRARQMTILKAMRAEGKGRLETARELVLAARPRLEQREPALDAVLNAAIKADVEVHERALLERTPIATVEGLLTEQIESAGERCARPALPSHHHVQLLGHGLAHLFEERAIQVLLAVEELLHRRAIKIEDEVHEF